MASTEEVNLVMHYFKILGPDDAFANMNPTKNGMKAVMHYLGERKAPVTAGELSSKLHVSTARMSVLLKKMENHDLIVRGTDPLDKRKTVVWFSEKGKQYSETIYQHVFSITEDLIDRVGMEKLLKMFELMQEVQDNMREIIAPQIKELSEKFDLTGGDDE